MQIEYRAFLRKALQQASFSCLSGDVPPGREDLIRNFEGFEVLECPLPDEGVVTTNVAFSLSKALSQGAKAADPALLPALLAEEIRAACLSTAAESGPWFEVRVGGLGYLNASPSPEFSAAFLRAAADAARDFLFTTESSIVTPGCPAPASLVSIAVDWRAKPLGSKLQSDPDCRAILDRIRQQGRPLRDDLLMLLAVCGDPELDSRAYLHGLRGRENVAWYLDRFVKDADAFVAGIRERRPEIPALTENAANALPELDGAVRSILSFRSFVEAAARRRRADLLVGQILRCARCFYAFYNCPDVRAFAEGRGGGQEMLGVYLVSQAILHAVQKANEVLDFSCGDFGFVLENRYCRS